MNDYPVITHGGEETPWVELRVKSFLANTVEDIDRNIESALKRDYISYSDIVGTESGAVSVVGSGPSLKENWKSLRDMDCDIIACNASSQFLLERGVVPKYMMCFDADPLMLEFLTPHKDITYLIASRCPPKAFEILEGCRVVCWHAAGDTNISELLTKHGKMEPMVAGGTAAVTRAMILAPTMGYTTIHIWGGDSSFLNGETHIRKSTTDEKMMHIMANNRAFRCAPWMAQQAEDFKILVPALRDLCGIKVVVHGDGLIPHLARAMHVHADEGPRAKQIWQVAAQKARILWSQL